MHSSAREGSRSILWVFVALALCICLIGGFFILYSHGRIRRAKLLELQAVAELKVKGIHRWAQELLDDGSLLASLPTGGTGCLLSTRGETSASFDPFAAFMIETYGYRAFRLYSWRDGTGPASLRLLRGYPPSAGHDLPVSFPFLDRASADSPRLGPLRLLPGTADVVLDLYIPLRSMTAAAVDGLLIIEVDPSRFLYPSIQSWPTPSRTGESLLVKREGDAVLFLNELRFRAGAALRFSIPLRGHERLPAAMALQGITGAVEGIDYRGERVVAWVRDVPGTEWSIVVKEDYSEAFAADSIQGVLLAIVMLSLLSAAGSLSLLIWERQRKALQSMADKAEIKRLGMARRFQELTRRANDCILLADDSLTLVEVNEVSTALYGYTQEELLGLRLSDLEAEPSPFTAAGVNLSELPEGGYRFETRHLRSDGSPVWVDVSASVFPMEGRRFVQEIVRDISKQKNDQQLIVESVREKEVLLRELHHRTKNNMQIISSLFVLQAEESKDPILQSACSDMVGRIRAMALVHEKLYQTSDISRIDFGSYLSELSELLVDELANRGVHRVVSLPERPVFIALDMAIPCGLIVAELLTNSLKYAFDVDEEGTVGIDLHRVGGEISLAVWDDGRGFPPGFDVRSEGRMGWQTILALAEDQLGASVVVAGDGGARVTITIPTALLKEEEN